MENENNNFPAVAFDEFPIPSYEEWKEEAVKLLKGGEFDKKLLTKTFEKITLKPIYTVADVENLHEFPGSGDFKRGVNESGYIEKSWDVCQEVLADSPSEANSIMKEELKGGSNSFYLKLSPQSQGVQGETGPGVHMFSHNQVREAFDGISFKDIGIIMDTGFSSYPYVYLISEAKGCFKGGRGIVGGDPLSAFAKHGKLPRSIDKLYDEMSEAVNFIAENSPNIRTVLVDSNIFADAGCDSVTELACAMAIVSEYMYALTTRGVNADIAAKSIGLSLSLGTNYFMEIAKLRAAKVMFAQLVRDFGAGEEASKAYIHAKTGEFDKTLFDPYVNVLRLTTEAFSGIIGGVDSLSVLPFDSAAGRSDAHSRRISRNISLMMAEEFGLKSPIDPSGGSWYVESLTNEFINTAWEKFMSYENAGGFYKALTTGIVQEEINKVLKDKKDKLNGRSLRSVGTNMYANPTEKPLDRQNKLNSVNIAEQVCDSVNMQITQLMADFSNGHNILSVYDKINTGSDEVCQCLKPHRLTEDYETVRLKTLELGGINVLLLNMGPVSQHKARADFSTGFFEAGGFCVNGDKIFDTAEAAISEALNSTPHVCTICSTDETYPELVPIIAKGIKEKNPNIQIILAGAPAPEYKDSYVSAGVDDFIHLRANCIDALEKIQNERGNKNV